MKIDKKAIKNIFAGIFGVILLVWVLNDFERVRALASSILHLIQPFVVGACLAFILNVPMRAIEKILSKVSWIKGKRGLSILLTFVMIVLVLMGVVLLLFPQLEETAMTIAQQLPPFFARVEEFVVLFLSDNPELLQWVQENTNFENIDWMGLIRQAANVAGQGIETILSGAVNAVGTVVRAIWNVFVSLIFALYCLSNKAVLARQFRRLMYAYLPESWADEIIRIFRLANSTFSNFISGQCLEVLILGCLFAVAMSIFRMPYVPLVSVLVAVTAFVPVVGAWIGCVLGAFFILVNNPLQAVWFVLLFLILQQIENNLIYPRVVGTSIGLPSMWVLVAVTIGGDLMGVAGMLLMIPLASVLYTLLREYSGYRLQARGIDPEKLRDHPPVLKSKLKEKREKARERREARRAAQLAEMMKRTLHIPEHPKADKEDEEE